MRVLITGAAGFIGSHLADRLIELGHEVHGIDNLETGRIENVSDGVEFLSGDVAGLWDTGGMDTIVHCAASYKNRENWKGDTWTNVRGAINVARAAQDNGCRVVYFQTALTYGHKPCGDDEPWPLRENQPIAPDNSYAISKTAAEQYLALSGVPLVVFRLANVYGPRNLSGPVPTFWKRLSEGDPCVVTDSRRDFVYIDDVVDVAVRAVLGEGDGVYHLSTGTDFAISEAYEQVAALVSGEHRVEYIPRPPDDAPSILLDPGRARREFGWQATTPFSVGIGEAVSWYSAHGVSETFTHLSLKG